MAKAIRTTENSSGETEGYTVINEEDGIGEVLYHVKPQDENEAEVVRYSPSAGGVSDANEEDKLPQRVPPSVANEIINLGFDQITVGETVMATEDPAEPAVGDVWYRTDLGVMRRQTPQGVAETRDFYRPGKDYEYTDFGIAPVTVLEEGFEETDPATDDDWTLKNEGGVPAGSVISVVTEESSEDNKSLKLEGDPDGQPTAIYTAVSVHTDDKVTVKVDALNKAVITLKGTMQTGLGPSEELYRVDLAAEELTIKGEPSPKNLDLGDIPDGWVSYTAEVDGTDVTVTVEDTNTTDTASVSIPAIPVDKISIGQAGTGASYVDKVRVTTSNLPEGTRLSPQITPEDIAGVELGGGGGGDSNPEKRGDPTLSEVDPSLIYVSDGSGFGAEGDLIYAYKNAGEVKGTKLAELANMTQTLDVQLQM